MTRRGEQGGREGADGVKRWWLMLVVVVMINLCSAVRCTAQQLPLPACKLKWSRFNAPGVRGNKVALFARLESSV